MARFHNAPYSLPVPHVQVEHGITELAHGAIDIVEAQLRLQVWCVMGEV
jgi:pyruvate carboxylase